jgi:nicotinate-nucleotide--dimethylbenzimidazole phosphoribosyltransferase
MHTHPIAELPRFDDAALAARVQHRLDRKTKPTGSLGRLESLALQLALVQQRERPRLDAPQLVVFAADHGIASHGVSAYPSDVTAQMVLNFLAGGAAVSVLARQHGLALTVVDCGVRYAFAPHAQLMVKKTAHGSADMLEQPAMSIAQCEAAIGHGREVVQALPGNALLLGEMGIGNTSIAALLMQRLTGLPLAQCTGRGTGIDDAGLARKISVLQAALERHAGVREPLAVLAALGGLEVATMVGAVLEAAARRRLIVVDGFISTAAVAMAAQFAPRVLGACVFSHCSAESGHAMWLERLGVTPLLDLGLRLGEGSGAALAWPLIVSAARLLEEMASFESAGVSDRSA